MSTAELDSLKTELLDGRSAAVPADLASLEEVRVGALGKKGRVSALMQRLGSMPPEERRDFGQAVNRVKTAVAEAIEAKREDLARAATAAKLAHEQADVTLPVQEGPQARGRIHPVSQVTDEITEIFADMGFSDRRRPGYRNGLQQLHRAQHSPGAPGTAGPRHVLFRRRPGRRTARAAHAHEPGAGPHHAGAKAAIAHHRAGPRLSAATPIRPTRPCSTRFEGPGDRRGDPSWSPEMGAGGVLQARSSKCPT